MVGEMMGIDYSVLVIDGNDTERGGKSDYAIGVDEGKERGDFGDGDMGSGGLGNCLAAAW